MMFVMLLSVGGAGGEAGVSPARDIAQKAAEAVVISGGTGLQTRPATAWGDTDLLVVWEDKRSGGYDIYGARIDATGKVLDPAGIPIGTATGDQTMPAVAWGEWGVVGGMDRQSTARCRVPDLRDQSRRRRKADRQRCSPGTQLALQPAVNAQRRLVRQKLLRRVATV